MANKDLEYNILNVGQSYDYLLNLSYRKMNDASYKNNKDKLKELQKLYKFYMQKEVYKSIWINEIDQLYIELDKGFKEGFYKEDENLFKK